MPKVKLGREESANLEIRAVIRKYMVLREVNAAELAKLARISTRTLSGRLNETGGIENFKLREVRRIIKALMIPAEEIAKPIIGLSR